MKRRFYMVDVFAERPYAGNPLAVVVGAEDWTDELMRQFPAETNFSVPTSPLSLLPGDAIPMR